jgi:hypothetical protein
MSEAFYAIYGLNGKYKTIAEATKTVQRYCAGNPGSEYFIMQAYAVAEIPITNVTITPIVATPAAAYTLLESTSKQLLYNN